MQTLGFGRQGDEGDAYRERERVKEKAFTVMGDGDDAP